METKNVVNEAVMGTANNVNGSYHEVGGSKKTTITEAVKYDAPSNIDNTDNDNVNDLIKMGLSGNQLQPCEKNINPIIDSYIHPANIPRPLRMLNCWYLIQGDNLIDVYSGEQHSTSEPPTAQQFDMCVYGEMCHHTEALAFALTKENRIGVIRILNVVDLRKGTVDSAVNEVIKTFPDNSVSVYYAPNYGSIDIIFKYGEGTEIESMEFTDSHNLRIRICSAGDFWKTRAYLYSIKYCSLVECAGVEKAIGALGICKHSEEIQESNEDQLITECGSISETTVSDVIEDKTGVEEYDFSDLFTPCEPDTINAAKETEPPDMIETKTQFKETQALCPDMESEIPDEELKKIQEIADYVKIPDGVPRTTEDECFNWAALTDDTGDSPEVTLADFGITSCETIPADHNFAPSNAIIVNKKGKRINTDSFPYVLKLIKNWVLYQVIYDRKVPKDSRTGKNAKSNDSSTWGSFDEAVSGFVKYNADGIGIELTLVTYILVFDLDHVRNPETGELHPLVQEFLDMLPEGSVFVEISQSGTGLHLFFQYTEGLDLTIFTKSKMTAVFGENTCFECYTHDRYIAMTGNLLSEKFANIRPSTEVDKAITQIYKRCLDIYNGGKVKSKPKTDSKPAPALSRPAPKLSDDDVIRLAYRQNSKFRKLAEGDISDYDNDDSRADAAFIYTLCYYTKDAEQLDSIYRRWHLARDKWDSPRTDSTYGQKLIQKALKEVTAQYYPKEDISISSIDEPFSFDINYLKKIKLNEIATAALFADAVRKIVIYTYDTKEYYYYNGKYWQLNKSDMKIRQIAKQFVLYIDSIICAAEKKLSESKDEGEDVEDEKRLLAKMGQYYSKFTKLSSRNRLIEDIQDEIVHSSEEFDKDPYKLCVENGVLDLEAFNPASGKTEKLLPHRPEFMISKIANVYYDPNKNEAKFHQVLDTILDHNNDKKRYLSSILGYTLLGEAYEEQFYLILGKSTRNGKSLVFESYANLLGLNEGYSRQISAQTLLYSSISKSGSDPMPDIVRLKGTRMIVASEPKKGSVLNVELLKQLTGNDQICARTLHSGTYSQFENAGTIFLLANNSPDFSDDTIMDSDRLKIVTFNHHFSEQERDITLKNLFKTDSIKSTMLNFALSGLTDYLSKGMEPYKGMKEELQEYSYSSDYLQQFLDENVTVLPDSVPISHGIKLSSLRKIYSVFAKDTGFTPCGLRLFREDLIKHFIRVERHDNQYYVACRIKGEMSLDDVKSKADGAWRMKYRENNNR